jgi:hypothetical protein
MIKGLPPPGLSKFQMAFLTVVLWEQTGFDQSHFALHYFDVRG